MQSETKRNTTVFLAYYALIATVALAIYFPSLSHMPRSDHFLYLANTADQHDFFSLIFKNYAFNRMDLPYGMRDDILFRPLLYAFLGLERWLFGLDFVNWQAAGIFLHLIVLWFLLKFLHETYKGFWAFLFVLFFAVLFAGSEMVIWSHINGYMLFVICALYVLIKIQNSIRDELLTVKDLFSVMTALVLAVFIYEFGVILCLLIILYFAVSFVPRSSLAQQTADRSWANTAANKLTAVFCLCLPVLSFLLLNFLDLHHRHITLFARSNSVFISQNAFHLVGRSASTFFWWLHSGFFPSRIFTETGQRTFMYPLYVDFSGKPAFSSLMAIQTLVGAGLIMTLILIVVKHADRPFYANRRKILGLLFSLLLSYALMISLGRVSTRGQDRVLIENPYYHYIFWAFFIPFLYNLVPFGRLDKCSNGKLRKTLAALLLLLIAFNGRFTFQLTSARAQADEPQWALNRYIRSLAKRSTPSAPFTFRIDPSADTTAYYLGWAKRPGDESDKTYNYFELLYPEYYRESGARHILPLESGSKALPKSGP